jgi:hypothetical protein
VAGREKFRKPRDKELGALEPLDSELKLAENGAEKQSLTGLLVGTRHRPGLWKLDDVAILLCSRSQGHFEVVA